MAKSGFIIGFSVDTVTNPDRYWNGTEAIEGIDDAQLFPTLAAARIQAGTLQVSFPENHVEPYPAQLAVTHTPPLPTTGAGGV